MSRHEELRATWAPGQIWETRIEECAADPNAWVPVAGGGRMEPLWDERQEYRQRPAPVPAPAPALPRPEDVPSIYDVIPPRAHKWLEGYGAAEAAWYEGWDGCRLQCRQRLDAHLQRGRDAPAAAASTRPRCIHCGRTVADGVALHRQNKTGEPGVWACDDHNKLPVDPLTQEILDAARQGEGDGNG